MPRGLKKFKLKIDDLKKEGNHKYVIQSTHELGNIMKVFAVKQKRKVRCETVTIRLYLCSDVWKTGICPCTKSPISTPLLSYKEKSKPDTPKLLLGS